MQVWRLLSKLAQVFTVSVLLIEIRYYRRFVPLRHYHVAFPKPLRKWSDILIRWKRAPSWKRIPPSVEERCFEAMPPDFSKYDADDVSFLATKEGKRFKKIVIWQHGIDERLWFGMGVQAFKAACCLESRCFLTNRRDAFPVQQIDALIFDNRGFLMSNMPAERYPHQKWILYDREPPWHGLPFPLEMYFGLFNWTMTFRMDSDVVAGYGAVFPWKHSRGKDTEDRMNEKTTRAHIEKKTKLAAWIVSHCSTWSAREKYVRELQKYIEVDIYGRCGSMECTPETYKSKQCYQMMEEKYKFYLAFENSLCLDYVTEKFFNVLQYYIVPVVLGFADYESMAPPHSYIDVRDFPTPKDLAHYLKYLDNNYTAYVEYFQWKKNFAVVTSVGLHFCDLCYKLHNDNASKTYPDFSDWFIRQANCHAYNSDLPMHSSSQLATQN